MTHVAGMESELPMASSLDRLRMLLLPPEVAPAPQPWEDVERRLGVALPNDYKEFMETYGGGTIEEFLIFLSYSQSFEAAMGWKGRDLEEIRMSPEDVFPGGAVEEGKVNLLPWAYTIDGDVCYWLMDPREDPDQWRVVSRERDMEWNFFGGGMMEFLVEITSGRRREPWFPDDFLCGSSCFKTTAQYLADRHGGLH
ncbi:SMI1/KNR4 family protein [Actinopolyspora lacussalsi]